jgi:hypothetical protein
MRFQPPVKERVAVEAAAEEDNENESFTARLLGFLWSARIFLVTGLVLIALVAAYGYVQPKVGASAGPPLTFAAVGDKITTADWTYSVVSVERTVRLTGASTPSSGGYLVIHITAARRSPDAPNLDPSGFALIDSTGARALPFPSSSDVYGASTGLLWAARHPTNTVIHDHLAFDMNPSVKGLVLLIKSANVQVRLPD